MGYVNFQRNLLGNQGQGATGQLLWLTHTSLVDSCWVFQWGRDLCSIQEPSSHGNKLIIIIKFITYLLS